MIRIKENMNEDLKNLIKPYLNDNGEFNQNQESVLITELVKKHKDSAGFAGFKFDMDQIFEQEKFQTKQLTLYYNINYARIVMEEDRVKEIKSKKIGI